MFHGGYNFCTSYIGMHKIIQVSFTLLVEIAEGEIPTEVCVFLNKFYFVM